MAASLSDYVAIYGAALSTLVGAWSFYQWFTQGPKLAIRIVPNQRANIGWGGKSYVFVAVANRGSDETTVTGAHVFAYKNLFGLIRNKGRPHYPVIDMPRPHLQPFPQRLAAGHEIDFFIVHDEKFDEWARKHRTYLLISHSMSDKPLKKRIAPFPVDGASA